MRKIKDDTPGSALAKLISTKLSGKDCHNAQKQFDEAQETWAKKVSLLPNTSITVGNKCYENGKLVKNQE